MTLIKLWFILALNRRVIVHYFLPLSYLVGLPISILSAQTNTVMSRRCLNHYQRKIIGLRFIETIYHKITKVLLGNSNAVVHDLREEGAAASNTRLLYNGIPLQENNKNKYEIRQKYNLSNNSLLFIIVANLIPYKGHRFLLKSFSLIADKLPNDWRLLIVGDDRGIQADLEQYSIDLKIHNNLMWMGALEKPHPLFLMSDIGVLSSSEEGFSNSILEAMSAKLPMVVTDVGGNAEAVIHNETGFVVPYGDESKMSQALLKLAQDENLRDGMGEKACKRIQNNFTLDKCVEKYHQLYTAIANNKPIPDLDTPKEFLG